MNSHSSPNAYQPIENYGIIGNLHTVSLVSLTGSIDFLSFTRFDSPTIFCKLLDAGKGGSFSIRPQMKDMVSKQLYLPDTNVLLTRFFANEGIAEIIDFMPIDDDEYKGSVIRKITTVRGKIDYRMVCAPRFHYASITHEVKEEDGTFVFIPEKEAHTSVRLLSDTQLTASGEDVTSSFVLSEAQTAYFVLEAAHGHRRKDENVEDYVNKSYRQTIDYWQQWISQSTYDGRWKEVVNRSALTLKLLFSKRYGSIIAAPTFSLPETIGGARNWDYRYTWIRDAAFSMHAFLELGFMEEAESFLLWIKKQSSDKDLQLMFAIDGATQLDEQELSYMEGYRNSKPVRVGNAAHQQTQMDIYGELLETIYIYMMHGGDITYEYWKIIVQNIEFVIANWHKPDHSIWEVRGEKREFLFSRMMCWVAMDRAIKIASRCSFPYDILQWHKVRDEIFEDVYNNFWNEEKKAFTQYKGSDILDASALLMPILNIISPLSERWQQTMQAIDKDLRSDVMVYRYLEQENEVDGLKGREGTFTMCSFWHAECLALCGEIEKAKEHFEKMLGYANHLGLYAEQIGMRGEHLGNFPQAFTHLALISAAVELHKQEKNYKNRLPFKDKEMK